MTEYTNTQKTIYYTYSGKPLSKEHKEAEGTVYVLQPEYQRTVRA